MTGFQRRQLCPVTSRLHRYLSIVLTAMQVSKARGNSTTDATVGPQPVEVLVLATLFDQELEEEPALSCRHLGMALSVVTPLVTVVAYA